MYLIFVEIDETDRFGKQYKLDWVSDNPAGAMERVKQLESFGHIVRLQVIGAIPLADAFKT